MESRVLKIKQEIEILELALKHKSKNKKEIKGKLKKFYKELKLCFKECKDQKHNFGEWEEILIKNEVYLKNYHGYMPPFYPIYIRKCLDCGYEEIRLSKPKEKKKIICNKKSSN